MRALGIGVFCTLAACGNHETRGHDPATATLSIDPPSSELLILNGAPASEGFTATLTFKDGTTQDVTADTTFTINDSFGGFQGATLTMTTAGKTTVGAMYTDKMASAEVICRLQDTRVDPGVNPNAPGWFSGPEDPTRAPHVVYPAVGVIMPRNLGDFEVHWTDSAGNDTFEVSLTTEFANVKAYVPGGNGQGGVGSWTAFLASEWTAAVGAETTVQFQVRGVSSANPTSVGSAAPQLVKLSNEEMLGGIYYWASAGTEPEGIYRHDMSMPGQPAQQYETTAQLSGTAYNCVACHVLSRDGKEMLVTYQGGDGPATTLDVATKAAQPAVTNWNFATFTPDGNEFLSVYRGTLSVHRYSDQSVVATMSASGWVTHPDLSPDGTKLVYVHPSSTASDWSFDGGSIFMRTFDPATNTFGPEQQIVADGQNNYYPSFSPDGQWILFNKAPIGGNAYNNGNAELWVVKADNTLSPLQLATANVSAGLTDSWGRWAPFAQTFGQNSEQMYWITVSSKRDFGVRLVGVAKPQIWMTPFFPDRAAAQQDPSAAAFRLPFQDIATNNHIAQWTEQVVQTQ